MLFRFSTDFKMLLYDSSSFSPNEVTVQKIGEKYVKAKAYLQVKNKMRIY